MKAVLFDLDNTLLIKRPSVAEKWYEVLFENGYCVTKSDVRRAFAACEMWVGEQTRRENESGIRMSDEAFLNGVMGCCVAELGIDDGAMRLLAPVWMGDYPKQYELAEDAEEVLETLHARDVLLGIVSNNHSGIRKVLEEMNLTKYFRAIVISEEVNLYKPDPQILMYACAQLEIEPKEAVYVGDHPYDVVCAHGAGMSAAWILTNEFMKLPPDVTEPDRRLSRLSELLG